MYLGVQIRASAFQCLLLREFQNKSHSANLETPCSRASRTDVKKPCRLEFELAAGFRKSTGSARGYPGVQIRVVYCYANFNTKVIQPAWKHHVQAGVGGSWGGWKLGWVEAGVVHGHVARMSRSLAVSHLN